MSAIVAEARQWIGTRWRWQGMVKGVGCDCVGLIAGVGVALGYAGAVAFAANPCYRGYGRRPDPALIRRGCAEFLTPVDDPAPGDVLLMTLRTEPQHFAFLSAPDTMIHAYASARRVVENRIDDAWRRRIVRAYRLRGIA